MVLQSLEGLPIAQTFKYSFSISNNKSEYKAMLLGLQMTKELSFSNLELCCDSQLVASQIRGVYEAKNERMAQYLAITRSLVVQFTVFLMAQILRSENRMANILANLASSALYPCHMELNVMAHPSIFYEAILIADT